MNLNKNQFSQLISNFKLKELFNELGWDNVKKKEFVSIDEDKFELDAVGEKRSFVIFLCSPGKSGKIPNQNIRRKIDNKVSKLFFEHLIIYCDANKSQQIWQLVIRQPNKPIIPREFVYYSTQYPEILLQKLSSLFFSIDDEENISLPDVKARILNEFNNNAEKVTKKFYERFQKELGSFQKFIQGIENNVDKEWYASLMLNRLMFIYFIQKKGFLDSNLNYLFEKLKLTQKTKGKDKFYSFYKDFLIVLFHDGLGAPNHSKELVEQLGKIPYLNGGLFEKHQLEKNNTKINIDDKAFEKIFSFFDEYNWHLDNSPTSSGTDINPDVIGYIFEKYINDRAAMGAYYTKEDITEYISKNTIIPFLFDEVKKECANAFRDESSLWKMLRENPDRYIYDAVKHGIYEEVSEQPQSPVISNEVRNLKVRLLPPEIQKGINPTVAQQLVKDVENNPPQLLELRKEWNKQAPPEYALPTEIWREVVERRSRYFDIRNKIESGEIKEINDFITYNLDIRQFAQDAVEQYEGSDFINAFYKAVTKISVLDPTCGSGAFLFAALNILEPVYETCISRMLEFIEQDNLSGGKKFKYFREVIEEINHHPNEKYFIYKSIILKNLFGVDIMKEATEIAKLRLFLKLVAEVEVDYKKNNLGLEPLPDIDFNIRSGNTLVGFAKADDVDKSVEGSFDETFLKDEIKKVKEEAEVVSMAFQRYKDAQLISEKNSDQHIEAKQELNNRLKSLNDKLNIYQARLYGIDPKKKKEYETWKTSHQPFHWFVEFYEIIKSGGFDVIIGNPPYVEYSATKKTYSFKGYETISAGNLYAYVIERAIHIQKIGSYNGMIIPLSAYCTDRMDVFQNYEFANSSFVWLSNFAERPSKLFLGAERNLTISILQLGEPKTNCDLFTTYYYKWNAEFRKYLFENISYFSANGTNVYGIIPKVSTLKESNILKNFRKIKNSVNTILASRLSEHILYYRNSGGRYWKIITDFQPQFFLEGKQGISSRESYLYFNTKLEKKIITAIFNSSFFYWYYVMHSDARTNNPSDLKDFPIDLARFNLKGKDKLAKLNDQLMSDLENNSEFIIANLQTGKVKFQQFYPMKSKSIIDEIDKILAEHYGFTEEELDFIINYDIKYRMGKELEEE